ncbi:MAG TPA: hypothetical protein VNT51_14105 [Miltoncostaeaceae bacterium]|nr:hypothetical protein [Miltoncostaeaceae bacterium]
MPTIRRGIGRRIAVAAAAVAALAVPSGALASGSGGPCNLPATAKVFAQFGDENNYYLAKGGGFEYGLSSLLKLDSLAWLGTYTVASQNDPYRLAGDGRSSARLRWGGLMTKTAQCVSADQPHLRLMARSLGDGPLVVRVDTVSLRDVVRSKTTVIPAAEHGSWAPSRFVSLDTSHMEPHETGLATITVVSQGDWLVDNVFIDPYAR